MVKASAGKIAAASAGIVLFCALASQAHVVPSRDTQLQKRQSATPDPQYATVISPPSGQTVKLDGSSLVDLEYYGIGGDSGLATKLIRIYVLAESSTTAPPEQPTAAGDQRYGLDAFMTLPPNGFQPGSTQQEIDANSFNAYRYPKLPLPRADVKEAFNATLFLLETYTSPDDHGLDRVTRQAIPIRVVPS